MTPAEYAIEVHGLSKQIGKVNLLEPLNLLVPNGSVMALVGHNGAGKTTLLKLLLNILQPSSGSATVLGVPSTHLRGSSFFDVGYVSETQEMPKWMTIQQLMDHLKPLYPRWSGSQLLEELQLPPERKIKDLSRGMRMKTALASVIAASPKLLLMDEPFTGLDTAVRTEIIQTLHRAHDGETTVLISSHDLEEMETFASHVAFLKSGRLLSAEPLDDLLLRCREVTVTFSEAIATEEKSQLPFGCAAVEAQGAMLRFVDLHGNVEGHEEAIRSLMPTAIQVQSDHMNLRSIFLALNKADER